MKKIVFIFSMSLLVIALLPACSQKGDGKYYIKERWVTSDRSFPVRAKPKKVMEFLYNDVNNISLPENNKNNTHEDYEFDKDGRLLRYGKYSARDSTTEIYIYTDTGYSVESETGDEIGGRRGKIIFQFIPDGNGDFIKVRASDQSGVNKYSYRDNGNLETEEYTRENGDYQTVEKYYKGSQITKQEVTAVMRGLGKNVMTILYYYGKDNGLDSTVSTESISPSDVYREIFTRNEHGDPIRHIRISTPNDTSYVDSYSYIYDQQGNWIRRLKKEQAGYMPEPKYALIIRKIEY